MMRRLPRVQLRQPGSTSLGKISSTVDHTAASSSSLRQPNRAELHRGEHAGKSSAPADSGNTLPHDETLNSPWLSLLGDTTDPNDESCDEMTRLQALLSRFWLAIDYGEEALLQLKEGVGSGASEGEENPGLRPAKGVEIVLEDIRQTAGRMAKFFGEGKIPFPGFSSFHSVLTYSLQ